MLRESTCSPCGGGADHFIQERLEGSGGNLGVKVKSSFSMLAINLKMKCGPSKTRHKRGKHLTLSWPV